MKHNLTKPFLFFVALMFATPVFAQVVESTDTVPNRVSILTSQMEVLQRLKFSGYIQAQFQDADSSGIRSFEGGDFPSGSDKRFSVRRGRLKAQYDYKVTQFVLQFDVTERGVVIKDVYGKITEPWLNAFSLTAGAFNRPFGFEVPYSSSQRESPERARWSQTIFPAERDLGAMVSFQMPKTSPWSILKLDAGMFNGTGTNPDFDFQKDFIGNISINKVSKSEKFRFGIGGSYYNGGILLDTMYVNRLGAKDTAFHYVLDKSKATFDQPEQRQYVGFNAQFTGEWLAGITTLRAEYIQGTQPATKSNSGTPTSNTGLTGGVLNPLYEREFNGAAFYFIHGIVKTPLQIVVKYDWYDPNTKVEGNDIGAAGSNLNATDVKYSTLGFGMNVRLGANAKFLAYYAMPTNETTKLTKWTKDIKDNVLTLRMQYKF